jgi:hypothetical protein
MISKHFIVTLEGLLISLQGVLHGCTFGRIVVLDDAEVIFWFNVFRVEQLFDCSGTVAAIIEEAICGDIHTNNGVDVIVNCSISRLSC